MARAKYYIKRQMEGKEIEEVALHASIRRIAKSSSATSCE